MSVPAAPDPCWARFDDLVAGQALLFSTPPRVLAAWTPAEVPGVLAAVEQACAQGSWAAGFVAYEAAAGLGAGLPVHPPEEGLPLVWFGVVDDAPEAGPPITADAGTGHRTGPWVADAGRATHAAAVAAVRERIAAGDTYQVNLTTRLRARTAGDPLSLYADLALAQRGSGNAYLDTGRFAVASASPELFFTRDGDQVVMAPMKGTAARGPTTAADQLARAALLASPKERAENVMIVDLVRNDLAQVAVVGGVEVTRLLSAERYPTVHQLTSEVRAQLRPGTGLVDLFTALFPCGSITGAPKTSTTALITELEPGPRGVYCGAVGYVGPAAHARFTVAIRTAVVDRSAGTAVYGVGGGITWSSEAEAEYAELETKARILAAPPAAFELLETMRHEAGRGLVAWPGHRARLTDSAAYFGFRLDVPAVEAALQQALAGAGDARVRLRCGPDGEVAVDLAGLPAPRDLVRLAVDDEPVDETVCWPHHKTTLRAPYDTRLARHPGADDMVLVNTRGEVTETCRATLAVRLDGVWWTPPLGGGCLPGVARAAAVASGRLRERALVPDDLVRAEGLAVLNALRGWEPATLV
ncbi:aminodeoxychorismate synthase component I [Klenkia terrae]|uniref:Aminodeoxychorismate synthase component I n=1 Tax=Klenkia terrae TaxID=1052259 RepID=A0ABU8ECK9_9ACTN|nr:aminodeoxychorismate synthase component I [Klenkia terrae]